MIKLINGRGQLGSALQERIRNIKCEKNIYVYHTWKPWQVDSKTQEEEYKKFIEFVKQHKSDRVVLISTYSENESYYVYYKQMSEAYLIQNCQDCLVIRLPSLVGDKGILKRLKEGSAAPYGKIEFLTLKGASKKIVKLLQYDGLVRSFTLRGEEISAVLVDELIKRLVEEK